MTTDEDRERKEAGLLRYIQALLRRDLAGIPRPTPRARTGQALADHTRHFSNAKTKRRRREKARRQHNQRMRRREG